MEIKLKIPKEFMYDFVNGRFGEFFERISVDLKHLVCGQYEEKTLEMMKDAFANAIPLSCSDKDQTIVVDPSDPKSVTAAYEYLQKICEKE